MALGRKMWNALHENLEKQISFTKFKEYIELWSRPTFKCKMGTFT